MYIKMKNVHINVHFKSRTSSLAGVGLGYAYTFKGVGNKPVTYNLD